MDNIIVVNFFVACGFFVLGCIYVLFVDWLSDKILRWKAERRRKERIEEEFLHKVDMIYKFAMHHGCMYEDKDNK